MRKLNLTSISQKKQQLLYWDFDFQPPLGNNSAHTPHDRFVVMCPLYSTGDLLSIATQKLIQLHTNLLKKIRSKSVKLQTEPGERKKVGGQISRNVRFVRFGFHIPKNPMMIFMLIFWKKNCMLLGFLTHTSVSCQCNS